MNGPPVTSPDAAGRARPEAALTPAAAAAILATVGATAGLGALATTPVLGSRWYRRLRKPRWQPPGPVFGPVWTVIYALIAASMLLARSRGGDGQRPLFVLFGTNMALNLAWTLIFFRGRSPLAAGVEIVVLEGTTVALVVHAWPISRLAGLLLVPYALWIAFATALTWAIWARNLPRFGAVRVGRAICRRR
jgi:translocator protein